MLAKTGSIEGSVVTSDGKPAGMWWHHLVEKEQEENQKPEAYQNQLDG